MTRTQTASLFTDQKLEVNLRDYQSPTYPVVLQLATRRDESGQAEITLFFETREAARRTLTELIGKCNGWLADELGIHREDKPPEPWEVWPEAEREEAERVQAGAAGTLSTGQAQAAHKAPRGVWGSGAAR